MKVLVSHDVDHLCASEHYRDGILLKFAARSVMELSLGRIGFPEFTRRAGGCTRGDWHRLEQIMDHDENKGIRSTFFFGTANGLGLSYGLEAAASWIRRVESRGFGTGVHGIAFDDAEGIRRERERFRTVSARADFGIRMHYLRRSPKTSELLASAGYAYDATPYMSGNPWLVSGMPVFPLHIMDGRFLETGRFGLLVPDRQDALERAKSAIEREERKGTEYFSILFHDRYFSDEFQTWKWWYEEVTEHLRRTGHEFVDYEEARSALLKAAG